MELKIKHQEERKFLGRRELLLDGRDETTPSKAKLKEEIAKLSNSNPEMVVIKRVNQQFGKKDFCVNAYVYENEKSFKEFEKEKKKKTAEAAK